MFRRRHSAEKCQCYNLNNETAEPTRALSCPHVYAKSVNVNVKPKLDYFFQPISSKGSSADCPCARPPQAPLFLGRCSGDVARWSRKTALIARMLSLLLLYPKRFMSTVLCTIVVPDVHRCTCAVVKQSLLIRIFRAYKPDVRCHLVRWRLKEWQCPQTLH